MLIAKIFVLGNLLIGNKMATLTLLDFIYY